MASRPSPPTPPALSQRPDLYRRLVDTVSDYAIFALDAEGSIATWNCGAGRIKGYTSDEILGKHFSVFYTPEALASDWPHKELLLAAEHGSLEDEGWRVRKDGSRFWANVVITALRDDDGTLIGSAKVTRDLTQKKLVAEALRQSEERFRLLVHSVEDYAICMLDTEGNIVSWNEGAQNIKGYSEKEALGRHFSMFYTADDIAAERPQSLLAQAQRRGTVHEEGWRVRKDGSLFWANVTLSTIYDAHRVLKGFAKVTRDMTERRQLEELEASALRMNRFLATLAHELRNPLAPIRTASTALELMPGDEALVHRNAEIVSGQLGHMTRLVDDLLDMGRVATGKLELRRSLVALNDILNAGIEAAQPFLDAKSQALRVHNDAATMQVLADLTRLGQVLQNVLLNASKFSPASSTICLRVRHQDKTLVIEVEDEGCGIASGKLEDIFNVFVQERQPGMTSTGGLGIGLSISRYIVEMHGGSIVAASPGEDMGSTFIIRLPIVASLPQTRHVKRDARPPPAPCKILIVDDNMDAADSLQVLLQMLGHEVKVAHEAAGAIRCVASFAPDVALIDLAMPDMDGFDLLAVLQKLPALSKTRFMALTGFGDAEMRGKTTRAGFHDHLMKPVDIDMLTSCLAKK